MPLHVLDRRRQKRLAAVDQNDAGRFAVAILCLILRAPRTPHDRARVAACILAGFSGERVLGDGIERRRAAATDVFAAVAHVGGEVGDVWRGDRLAGAEKEQLEAGRAGCSRGCGWNGNGHVARGKKSQASGIMADSSCFHACSIATTARKSSYSLSIRVQSCGPKTFL